MKMTFYTATVGMMSHTLTAIISKFVTQKHLSVKQTAVITGYFYFYFATLSIAIRKIQRLWCESVSVRGWWNLSAGHWCNVIVEHRWNLSVELLWYVSAEHVGM